MFTSGEISKVEGLDNRYRDNIRKGQLVGQMGLVIVDRADNNMLNSVVFQLDEKGFDFHPYVTGLMNLTYTEIHDKLMRSAYERGKILTDHIPRYFTDLSLKFGAMYEGNVDLLYLGDLVTQFIDDKMVAKWYEQRWFYCPLASKGKFVMSGKGDSELKRIFGEIIKLPQDEQELIMEVSMRLINNVVDATVLLSHYQRRFDLRRISVHMLEMLDVVHPLVHQYVKTQMKSIFEFYCGIDVKIQVLETMRLRYFNMEKSNGVKAEFVLDIEDMDPSQQHVLRRLTPFTDNTVFMDEGDVLEFMENRMNNEVVDNGEPIRFMLWNPSDISIDDEYGHGKGGFYETDIAGPMNAAIHTLLDIDHDYASDSDESIQSIKTAMVKKYVMLRTDQLLSLRPGLMARVELYELHLNRRGIVESDFVSWLHDRMSTYPRGFGKFNDLPIVTVFPNYCAISKGRAFDLIQLLSLLGLKVDKGKFQVYTEYYSLEHYLLADYFGFECVNPKKYGHLDWGEFVCV